MSHVPWFKIDDKLHSHRKTMRAGMPAMGLWAVAGSWCADQLTDGFIPEYAVQRITPDLGLAEQLVAAGYWAPAEHDGESGWQYLNWEDYQPTRDQVEAKRAAARDRMQRVRGQGGDVRANSERTDAARSRSVTPTPTRPDPTNKNTTSRKRDGVSDDDPNWQAFWSAYPRKVGKGAARTAYAKALRVTDHATLMAAVGRYSTAVKGAEAQFIAHPATWLNQERWSDEMPQPQMGDVPALSLDERQRRMREAADAKAGVA